MIKNIDDLHFNKGYHLIKGYDQDPGLKTFVIMQHFFVFKVHPFKKRD